MTPSFGSRRRGKGLALPKHLWEKRREKGSRSYQSEHACSAPCVLGLSSAYFYPLSDAMRGNRDVHGAKLPEPIVSCSRARSTGRAPRALAAISGVFFADCELHVTPPGPKPTEGDAKARSIWGRSSRFRWGRGNSRPIVAAAASA